MYVLLLTEQSSASFSIFAESFMGIIEVLRNEVFIYSKLVRSTKIGRQKNRTVFH